MIGKRLYSGVLLGMGVIVGSVLAAQAGQIRYVSKTGENIAPYTSWRRAARTIHAAVRVSAAGDTIVVGPGVYAITSTIVLPGRVTLISKLGAADTTIQGNGKVRCVFMSKAKSTLDGFTITGGGTIGNGAGVYCNNGQVLNCVISSNHATGAQEPCGGGVYAFNYSVISNCLVEANSVVGSNEEPIFDFASGGGIYAHQSDVILCDIWRNWVQAKNEASGGGLFCNRLIDSCRIGGNTATGGAYASGGGVYSDVGGGLRNCLVIGNYAYVNRGDWSGGISAEGGGVYFFSGGSLRNCTIADNGVDGENASAGGYRCGVDDGIVNSIIYGNSAVARIQATAPDFEPNPAAPPTITTSCIGQNPGFASGSYELDGDLPSPCIDAGVNQAWMTAAKDIEGNSRISNGKVDIGAFEFIVRKIIRLSGELAFGNVVTGQTATAILRIENRGNRPLTLSKIVYPSRFYGPWSGVIPAGGSQDVTVRFRPLAATAYGGKVTVKADKTSGKNTIAVSGTGALPSRFRFSASAIDAVEGVGKRIKVKRVNGTAGDASVDYTMKPVTAQAWQDYVPANGTLTWTNGESAVKTIWVDILSDGNADPAEKFKIVLRNPVGAVLAAPSQTVVTIRE